MRYEAARTIQGRTEIEGAIYYFHDDHCAALVEVSDI